MQKGPIAALHKRTSCLGDRSGVDFGEHREPDAQPFFEFGCLLDGVNRGGNHLDTSVDKWASVYCEVNQLLTTVRSPVSSEKLHDRPVACDRRDNVDIVAVGVLTNNRRHDVAGI